MVKMKTHMFIFLIVFWMKTIQGADIEILTREQILTKALDEVKNVQKEITDALPDFFSYEYQSGNCDNEEGTVCDEVADKSLHHGNLGFDYLQYGTDFKSENYEYGTRNSHPFFGLMWIKNENEEQHTYRIQVESYFDASADDKFSNEIYSYPFGNQSRLSYFSVQYYSGDTPSICQIYFMLHNPHWGSQGPYYFTIPKLDKEPSFTQNYLKLEGNPKNVLMGYFLLSSKTGELFSKETTDKFLNATLYPLLDVDSDQHNFTDIALDMVEDNLQQATDVLANPYNYTSGMDMITNGGNDMFGKSGEGNKVYFDKNGASKQLVYGQTYTGDNLEVTSQQGLPFFTLMWITNPSADSEDDFRLRVNSDFGEDLPVRLTSTGSTITNDDWVLNYFVDDVYRTDSKPSICGLSFTLESEKWNSSTNFFFSVPYTFSTKKIMLNASVTGSPDNVFMGYVLLSKGSGLSMNDSEIKEVLTLIANAIVEVPMSENFLQNAKEAVYMISPEITSSVEDWHNYTYDQSSFDAISNDEKGMFNPWGNKIVFAEDADHSTYLETNFETFYNYSGFSLNSIKGHPFTALMWIDNFDLLDMYTLKINNHAELISSESYFNYEGSFEMNGTKVSYYAFQLKGKTGPSMCDVYFTLQSNLWSSSSYYAIEGGHWDKTNAQENYAFLMGSVKNMFVGYTLLSKKTDNITKEEVIQSLTTMTRAIVKGLDTADNCEISAVFVEGPDIVISFPETQPGETAVSDVTCPSGTINDEDPFATRECSTDGVWLLPLFTDCEYPTTIIVTTTSGSISRMVMKKQSAYMILISLLLILCY